MEKWKKIEHNLIKNIYSVSNTGKIRNNETNFIHNSFSNKSTDYARVFLKCKDNKKRMFLIHRLVALAFIPNPNNFPIINHIDENRRNNHIENLEWCNQKHNMQCWCNNRKRVE